jgi:hypothetical protein
VPALPRKGRIPICCGTSIVKSIEWLMHLYDMLFCNSDTQLAEELGID